MTPPTRDELGRFGGSAMRETFVQELIGGLIGIVLVVRAGLWYKRR